MFLCARVDDVTYVYLQNTTTTSDVFENKMSDVVKGTAKPLTRENTKPPVTGATTTTTTTNSSTPKESKSPQPAAPSTNQTSQVASTGKAESSQKEGGKAGGGEAKQTTTSTNPSHRGANSLPTPPHTPSK